MKESQLDQMLIAYIKNSGGDAWKVKGGAMQRRGEPDIDGWLPYLDTVIHLKLETKTAGGVVSPLQRYRLITYRTAGYCAGVVRSVEELKDLVQLFYWGRLHGEYLK